MPTSLLIVLGVCTLVWIGEAFWRRRHGQLAAALIGGALWVAAWLEHVGRLEFRW
jgi:hypothetical protein